MQGRDSVSDLNTFHGYWYLFGSAARRTIEVIAKRNLKAVPVLLKLGADANEKGASVALQVLFGCFFFVLKWSQFSKEIDDTRWNFRGHPNVKLKLVIKVWCSICTVQWATTWTSTFYYFLLHSQDYKLVSYKMPKYIEDIESDSSRSLEPAMMLLMSPFPTMKKCQWPGQEGSPLEDLVDVRLVMKGGVTLSDTVRGWSWPGWFNHV